MTSKTSKRKVIAEERRRRAWELRRAGWSIRAIARDIGVYPNAVYKMLVSILNELHDDSLEMARLEREIQLEQLDALHNVLFPQALQGDRAAIDRVIRIGERRAKLTGAEAPAKTAFTDPTGEREYNPYERLTDEQRLARIQEVIARLQQPPAASEQSAPE